jgi:hypothetical protein
MPLYRRTSQWLDLTSHWQGGHVSPDTSSEYSCTYTIGGAERYEDDRSSSEYEDDLDEYSDDEWESSSTDSEQDDSSESDSSESDSSEYEEPIDTWSDSEARVRSCPKAELLPSYQMEELTQVGRQQVQLSMSSSQASWRSSSLSNPDLLNVLDLARLMQSIFTWIVTGKKGCAGMAMLHSLVCNSVLCNTTAKAKHRI